MVCTSTELSVKPTSRKLDDWYARAPHSRVCPRTCCSSASYTSHLSKNNEITSPGAQTNAGYAKNNCFPSRNWAQSAAFGVLNCYMFAKCTYTNTKALIIKSGRAVTRPAHAVCVPVPPIPYPLSLSHSFLSFLVFVVLVLTGLCLFWLGMQTQRRAPNSSTGCRVFSAPSRRPSAGTCRGPWTMLPHDLDTWRRPKHLRRSRSVVFSGVYFKCFQAYN